MEGITEMAESMVRDFVAHRMDRVADAYGFPTVVYFGPDILIISDKQEFLSKIRAYRSAMAAKGLDHIHTVVTDLRTTEVGRCEFEVQNVYYSKGKIGLTQAAIRYFVDMREDAPKVRMVEYLIRPFDDEAKALNLFEIVH